MQRFVVVHLRKLVSLVLEFVDPVLEFRLCLHDFLRKADMRPLLKD